MEPVGDRHHDQDGNKIALRKYLAHEAVQVIKLQDLPPKLEQIAN